MEDLRALTTRALHDALAIRGLEPGGGGGFIRTTPAECYMSGERLRLARAVAEHLPATMPTDGITTLVDQLVPVVARAMQATTAEGEPTGPLVFRS